MSTTITVDAQARAYTPATDPSYRKQLDRGDTKIGVAVYAPSTNLLLSGTSHLLKTHAAAGTGRRSVCSIKDESIDTDTVKKDTVVVTAYHSYNNEDSIERCVRLFEAQYAYLAASDFAELRTLMRGGIDIA